MQEQESEILVQEFVVFMQESEILVHEFVVFMQESGILVHEFVVFARSIFMIMISSSLTLVLVS